MGNEREAVEGTRIGRDDVFIGTEVWISDGGHHATLRAVDESAGKLSIDRIWPASVPLSPAGG